MPVGAGPMPNFEGVLVLCLLLILRRGGKRHPLKNIIDTSVITQQNLIISKLHSNRSDHRTVWLGYEYPTLRQAMSTSTSELLRSGGVYLKNAEAIIQIPAPIAVSDINPRVTAHAGNSSRPGCNCTV
jgi:hypothetical protein